MKYKIIVDKQSRKNPSSEKKEYIIDIEELRTKGDIYDSLIITKNEDYVIRRLSLSELQVLSVLEEPIKEALPNLNIELFEGDNYIYLSDMTGNKFYAEYIVKNEFTDMYVTNAEMNSAINQSASQIELNVNQKLTTYSTLEELEKAKDEAIETSKENVDNKLKNYSTTVEMNSAINMKANEITSSVNETYITKTDSETNISNAKSEAISTAGTNIDNKLKSYSTTTQMNSAINQKAESITSSVSKTYSTKTETSTAKTEAINSANSNTDNKLKNYTETTKLGTAIEQNYEHVKIAWNQISEFIQMMIINNNASFAILDSNKKVMMALDKTGQHFYKTDGTTIFGEMGVNKEDSNNYISFAVDGEYNKDISDGMAWGIKTKSDNKYYPILYIKNFHMGTKNSDDIYGQLVLKYCDLILEGMNTGIQTGNVRMYGNELNGITFEDMQSGNSLFSIAPPNSQLSGQENGLIQILSSIMFYANAGGTNSFKIGLGNEYVLITDNGLISVQNGSLQFGTTGNEVSFSLYVKSLATIHGNLDVEGNVYANNISSDKRIKKNIKNSDTCALDIIKKIKHKEFDKKDDGKHYNIGYIAQDMEKIDPNFVIMRPKTEKTEERYYINELPIIATLTKAIQEQQEQIEQQNNLIQSLVERIKKLEAK